MRIESFEPEQIVIEENYLVPHLNDTRKITALLPHDYHETDRSYPVLYLQDGQNLFNPEAPFGNWAIDESLARLAAQGLKDIIIIAVDHGESRRLNEYLPYDHPKYGKGLGKHYIQFIQEKLIPYVNSRYRTLTGSQHTGIGGSSMGGLISLYAGLTQPDLFGKMLIFSPSLWISKYINWQTEDFDPSDQSRLYLYAGGRESESHLSNIRRLVFLLRQRIKYGVKLDMKVNINQSGEHGEFYWRQEFPRAIKWLYFNDQK